MINEKLTGIERDLVVQYLIDGNVPVTLTLIDEYENSEVVHPLNSRVFPVAIKGENLKVKDNGEIHLFNPSASTKSFVGKLVKVEFYFNRVGLFFKSEVKESSDGLVLIIPEKIERIIEVEEEKKYDFSGKLYFDFNAKADLNINTVPWNKTELFSRPVWKSIPLENQKNAKAKLEKYVEEAKIEKNAGNGIQLIPICNYITYDFETEVHALQKESTSLHVIYVDHERIVFGINSSDFQFVLNNEYGFKMIFSINKGPIVSRDIFVTIRVNKVYKDENSSKYCADCYYTTIQEEDLRFIYEKATSNLFI